MPITNLSERRSMLQLYLAELRDLEVQTDALRFRHNLERIGAIMAYEISRCLDYEPRQVETPLGVAEAMIPSAHPVLTAIMRAALPMHHGMLTMLDHADNAFVSAYRKHHKDGSFEVKVDYVSCPRLDGRVLVVCDPMIATGASVDYTLRALSEYGRPSSVHVATVVASTYGLEHLQRLYPEAHIWTVAVDEELTARSYIVPGLGDAGDLAFGPKMQD